VAYDHCASARRRASRVGRRDFIDQVARSFRCCPLATRCSGLGCNPPIPDGRHERLEPARRRHRGVVGSLPIARQRHRARSVAIRSYTAAAPRWPIRLSSCNASRDWAARRISRSGRDLRSRSCGANRAHAPTTPRGNQCDVGSRRPSRPSSRVRRRADEPRYVVDAPCSSRRHRSERWVELLQHDHLQCRDRTPAHVVPESMSRRHARGSKMTADLAAYAGALTEREAWCSAGWVSCSQWPLGFPGRRLPTAAQAGE